MAPLPWYHKTTLYQVYTRSFYDSNGDGIGDLRGILQKLEYIQRLGFETIWISPFFASPQRDFGYDISDYTAVAHEHGTMEEVEQLIAAVHQRGMRIILDMVLNHTSDEHPWFRESRSSRHNPKADWYIWRDRPNNWYSVTGGSGWHYARERGQYYWASFLPFQPDLNYRNPAVKQAMFDLIRFWLEKGVDGFRLDIINVVYKDGAFRDNPFSPKIVQTEDDYAGFFQRPKYNLNQPESFQFARELRQVCDAYGEKMLIGEATARRQVLRQYLGTDTNNGLGLMFNFEMLPFKFSADYFRGLIENIEQTFPFPFMPVYVFSSHDRHRSMTRLGGDVRKARLLHMLQLTVRGVPCMYYGEEIGMTNAKFPFATALDPVAHKFKYLPRFIPDALRVTINRDEVRTPMQWDGSRNAGFSSAEKTWLPVHPNYRETNVEMQDKDESSLWNTIRAVLHLRQRERAFREGSLELLEDLPENVLAYTRQFEGRKFMILLNFADRPKDIPVTAIECVFKLPGCQCSDNYVHLAGYGGVILRTTGEYR